ncbi:MAG: hypothetical protein WCP82_11410 [Alphaproteobacteria bacterium]
MNLSRRGFFSGLVAAAVAPAIVRSGLVMPIKPSLVPGFTVTLPAGMMDYAVRFCPGDSHLQQMADLLTAANDALEDLPWMTEDTMIRSWVTEDGRPTRTVIPQAKWRLFRSRVA